MSAAPPPASSPPDLSSLCLAITEHSPLPMATVEGPAHVLRYANPAFCRLMGQSLEELIGRPFDTLLPEKDECLTLLERVRRTGNAENYTEQDLSKPHPVFWSYTIWPVLAEEEHVGVMIQVVETGQLHEETVAMNEALLLGSLRQHELAAVAEDSNIQLRLEMAERQRVEDALRASEERFQVLFDLGPVAIFSCDRQGVLQNYNRRAAELWGREPMRGDEAERYCGSLRLFAADGQPLPHEKSPIVEVLETGKMVKDAEVSIERPDGSRIFVAVSFAPLRSDHGEIVGAISAFHDITERRELEDSLVARAGELAQADRSKDEFLAMLAHELRNPLAPLRHAAEILRTPEADAEEREQAHQILARQIANMERMIDDLLDVSRITEGKIELQKQATPLETIFTSAAHAARPGLAARGQELTVSLPAEPIFLEADPTRLDQVFGNLLGNACKYTGRGGHISLTAERTAGEPPEVLVRVRDNGVGIAPEVLPHIFDLFVQATRALDRAHGGLGIGLTLVQRLVKLHGGTVEARSDGVGQGSEFLVRLPILSGAAAAPVRASAPQIRDRPRRMLIVDDNEDSVRSLATLQRLRGHEVRTAFTGPEAVAIATEFQPEVVLLDIGLPGMDGFEVARRLRAMPALAGVFLVAISGYGRDEDLAEGRAAGFDEYVVKPLDLDLLRTWLRQRERSV
jgi:PAS domain S-box-containing protein